MKRRSLVFGLVGATMLPTRAVKAQQPNLQLRRIGRLAPLTEVMDAPIINSIRAGLTELGWHEGRSYVFETRFAGGRLAALPALASELVAANVDVILAGSNPGVAAAKAATSKVPIVMVTTGDPVAGGLVASLAKPGGNVTGVTALGQQLGGKRLEVLRDAFPRLDSVAVLVNPDSPYSTPLFEEIAHPARTLGIKITRISARRPDELEPAFAAVTPSKAGAIFVMQDIMFINHRKRIVELAARTRLPAIFGERTFVTDGGLMFYGASLRDMYRQSAGYIDRILKGARPADLPVQQPTRFSLVVNLKAAKSLGLTLAPSFLLRADEVIE
jgi:putative ABC transport system substrate-binding protein